MMLPAMLPDWNSLDSVRRAHSVLEGAGLAFFGLLVAAEAIAHTSRDEERKHVFDTVGISFFAIAVLCEIAGYWYGQRNDALSAQVISSLDIKAQDASEAAGHAKDKAGEATSRAEAVGKEADEAETRIAALDKRADVLADVLSARRIRDEIGLGNDLSKEFQGRSVAFDSYIGDEEAYWLCSQLENIAQKAGVDAKDECATKRLSKQLPIVDLHISAPSIDEAQRLSLVLKRPGRVPGIFVGFNVEPEIIVTVGVKPSIPLYPMFPKAARGSTRSAAKPSTNR
jgi:hypothetical protein